MAKKKGVWDIDIVINGEAVKNNLNDIGKEVGKLNRDLKKLRPGTDEFIKKSAELKKARVHYNKIKDEINQTNKELDQTNTTLDDVKGAFSNVFDGFLSGDIEKVKEGLQGVKDGFKGVLASARAFIATPIGLAITAIAGIGFGLKNWLALNLEIEKTNEQIRDITQTTGNATNAIRVRAESLKELFDVELNKSVEAAKSLVKGFGISYKEAFDQIESSAVKGKLKNAEFLDSVKEYPVQFKNAGYSVKDFINIVNAGIDLSIYTDKLPDALKEANLSLKQQSKATTTALTNAFGAQFSKSLLKRVKEGEITTKQALQEIAKESKKVNLNQQQQAQLTADLFKSAGEDAGGSLKILKAVNTALNEQQKPLTEAQKLRKEELEIKKELKLVTTQLFASGSEGLGNWITKGKIFATQTLLKILKGGVSLYNWFVDLNNESVVFSGLLSGIGKVATGGFRILGNLVKNAWESFKGLGNVVAGIFTGDWKRIKEGFKQSINFIPTMVNDIKKEVENDANDIYDALQGKNKKKRIDLKAFLDTVETNTSKSIDEPIVDDSKKATLQELTPEDKKIIESKKKLAEFLKEFKEEQKLQEELEKLEKDEAAQLTDELELEAKYAKLEADANGEKDLLLRLEEVKKIELQGIEDKYEKIKKAKDEKAKKDKEKRDSEHHKKQVLARKKLKNDIVNGAIALAGQETRVGQALLAAKGIMAAKESLIQLGIIKAKAATAVAEGTMATTVGAANTAKVGFPQNIPLLIGFAAQATSIISAIKNATSATKSIKGFEKGLYKKYPVTREDGKKFNARLGRTYKNTNSFRAHINARIFGG
ncbi:phage tail tape measure protein [Tenacibaculum sp. nBUS_03]|uniref:phage tail tape measure protein n=1 Tax=Tenacibaculum sp. nBUS_03 TaxID=3395320 RepID=UPI003EBC5826